VLNRVTAGAAPYANPQTAFHRRDAGIPAANNALTGIRASRSQFIKRTAAPDAAAEQEAPATAVSAGVAAAKRLANAAAATKAETSGFLQGSKETQRDGSYVALDVLESSEEGRELLAKIKASADGIEISYSPGNDRPYVYIGNFLDEEDLVRKRVWERTHAQTAQPAAVVEISDAGRKLAENQIRIIDKSILNDKGSDLPTLQMRQYDPANPSIEFPAFGIRRLGLNP